MTFLSSRRTGLLAGTAALAGGVAVARSRQHRADAGEPHWQAVTIYRDADDIAPGGHYPQPLAALDSVEIRMQPAPGDRGTEVFARSKKATASPGLLDRLRGTEPAQDVRAALRRSKELVEAGEVLSVDGQPEGRRPATLPGAVLDLVRRRSDRAGVL